jgi:hypothetical protein
MLVSPAFSDTFVPLLIAVEIVFDNFEPITLRLSASVTFNSSLCADTAEFLLLMFRANLAVFAVVESPST